MSQKTVNCTCTDFGVSENKVITKSISTERFTSFSPGFMGAVGVGGMMTSSYPL